MDSDSFFEKIDQRIDAAKRAQTDCAEHKTKTAEATRQTIAQVKPLLERYAAELRKRRIAVKLEDRGGDALTFVLQYTRGGHYGFTIYQGKLTRTLTEKGKSHQDEVRDISGSVNLTWFEEYVQKIINDFMLRAPGEGGFLSQF